MSKENEQEYSPVSFARVLGIIFMVLGIVGVIGIMVMYDKVPYPLQEEVQLNYIAMGAGVLLANLAIGSILITLDRIALALEKTQ